MATLRADEISNNIRERIEQYKREVKIVNTDTFVYGLARIHGLDELMNLNRGDNRHCSALESNNPVSELIWVRVINSPESKPLIDFSDVVSEINYWDRQTGKRRYPTDTILKRYWSKASSVAQVGLLSSGKGKQWNTLYWYGSRLADFPRYITVFAPYTVRRWLNILCTVNGHTLIIYDDLSKQAQLIDQMSLYYEDARRP
ncbi:hypothetical protein Cgig2_001624 [Carnegiea gigantea]|uniref:Uncharacterized protein n=1 Tax=Carnegiea gigantea TaxID=171969 RepID=A0A9Q1JFB5_9CARY|nr:hypothetical protein Cgig2_001624 [Carnegiea gigantea]